MKKTWQRGFSALLTLAMLLSLLVVPAAAAANDLTITKAEGWMESAYVTFTGTAERYNVYVAPQGGSYTKLDNELVRAYEGYFRADALGLKAGSYTMKVVPVENGAEVAASAAESDPVTVTSYVREGFAFSKNSPNGGTGVGAYNDDGTLKTGARILYVTDGNKDTLTMTVKGTQYTGLAKIIHALEKDQSTPVAIRFIGRVTDPDGVLQGGSANEYGADAHTMQIVSMKNLTLEGVGDDATLHGWIITFKKCQSVEVRNLGTMYGGEGGEGSTFVAEMNNSNLWFHNLDFFYGAHGKDADQVKGDGTIDLKKQSSYVTISYNHMWDIGKTCVSGGPDENSNFYKEEYQKFYVSYHHNWFDHTDSRHPRCVVGTNHVYNNYYDGCAMYGIGAAMSTSVFSESNVYRNVPRPMIIGTQGSECWDGTKYASKGTLSGQGGGIIKSYGDKLITPKRFVPYGDPLLAEGSIHEGQFDAYVATTRDEKVPSTVQAKVATGTHNGVTYYGTYNNFDTDPSIMYSYTPHTADQVVEVVTANAGRMNGGDFKWTFTAADDADHDLNEELRDAIRDYESPLKAVAFGDVAVVPPEKPADPNPPTSSSAPSSSVEAPSGMKAIPAGTTTLAKDWNGGQTMTKGTISADGYICCYKDSSEYKSDAFSVGDFTATRGYRVKGTGRSLYIIPAGECDITVYFYRSDENANRALSLYTNTNFDTPVATGLPEGKGAGSFTYHFTAVGSPLYIASAGGDIYIAGIAVEGSEDPPATGDESNVPDGAVVTGVELDKATLELKVGETARLTATIITSTATAEPSASESPKPSESSAPSESPKPSESPEPSQSVKPSESPTPSESPEPSQSVKPSESPTPSESPEPSQSPEPSESPEGIKAIPVDTTTWAKDWNNGETMNKDTLSADSYVYCYNNNNDYKSNKFTVDGVEATRGYHIKSLTNRSFYIKPAGECDVTVYCHLKTNGALTLYTSDPGDPVSNFDAATSEADYAYTYHFKADDVGSLLYITCNNNDAYLAGIKVTEHSEASEASAQLLSLAELLDVTATGADVTWSSDKTGVATVDRSGLVTAVAAGTATITVTTKDGGYTDTCAVTVTAEPTAPADKEALTAAIAAAEKTIDVYTVSDDTKAADVTSGTKFVKQSDKAAYQAAIDAAKAVAAKAAATQAEVDQAVTDLAAATTAFNKAIQTGTKSSSGGGSGSSGGGSSRPSGGNQSGTGTSDIDVNKPASENFGDVVKDSWYEPGVTYVVRKGLFIGISKGVFAPEMNMTRAMLMTVLARLDDQETEGGETWYAKGMAWAMEAGISDGTMPETNVTREQVVTMLFRYANPTVLDKSDALGAFNDAASVSDWAVQAMQWAVKAGVITGKDGQRLDPQGTATRAEVAAILQRFVEARG